MTKQSSPRKRRKPKVISTGEAVARLTTVINLVERDLKTAQWCMASFQAANDQVKNQNLTDGMGADTFNTIQQSMTIVMALAVAKMFDKGSQRFPVNDRRVASLVTMFHLLKQKRCIERLLNNAANWTPGFDQSPGCRKEIQQAIRKWRAFVASPSARARLKRIREFRHHSLAHTLFDSPNSRLPVYNDVFEIISVAEEIVKHAKSAIIGEFTEPKERAEMMRRNADWFWARAVKAQFLREKSQ